MSDDTKMIEAAEGSQEKDNTKKDDEGMFSNEDEIKETKANSQKNADEAEEARLKKEMIEY